MFEINLFDIIVYLCIGGFSFIAILYLYYISIKLFDVRKHNCDAFLDYLMGLSKEELKQSGYTIFLLICVFTLGILTQDLTDNLSDSETSKNRIVSLLQKAKIIETEGQLRVETLIDENNNFNSLGKEIFSNNKQDSFQTIVKEVSFSFSKGSPLSYWKEVGQSYWKRKQTDSLKEFTSLVNGIYYTAKNWCYTESEPVRKELVEIQSRIDLARSLTIVSLITGVIIFTLYLTYYLRENLKGKKKFKVIITRETDLQNVKKTTVERIKFSFPVKSILILALVFYIGKVCYNVAENNFNERAFGYFLSHFKYSK